VQVAWSNGKVWFGKNNTWYDSTFGTTGNPSAGTNATVSSLSNNAFSIAFCGANASPVLAANFGQQAFIYTPPTGFKALNTYNLPDSTIVAGNKVMDATTYTGTSAAQNITNAGGFKPDLVWTKSRSDITYNGLTDSVRGVSKALFSNAADAESSSANNYVTAFNSNGFGVNQGSVSGYTGYTYVGWQWQAGQGTTSSNTSGSITSTVSVNATAGFSVVTYTGTGANATVGHGLGVAPKMLFVKSRTGVYNWRVWQTALAGTDFLYLNATDATTTNAAMWNSTTPTSSVFSLGTNAGVNNSGDTFVAYCWSEIAGFSKFGSYTGNGSADGPFIYLGFRPKWLMIKRTDSATSANWPIIDTSRDTYNVSNKRLFANYDYAEDQGIPNFADLLSNGFKLRDSNASENASGGTYIYMAFAENPFKNALAR
jgi:hypothetical protein